MDAFLEHFYKQHPDAPIDGDTVLFEGKRKLSLEYLKLKNGAVYTVKRIMPENLLAGITTKIELMEVPGLFPLTEFRKMAALNKLECAEAVNRTLGQIDIASWKVGDYVRVKRYIGNSMKEFGKIMRIHNGAVLIAYGGRKQPDIYKRYDQIYIPFEELEAVKDE